MDRSGSLLVHGFHLLCQSGRDKRPERKQVCFGLVVTPEGLPLAYEVFAGNRADVTTVEEIVEAMEKKYGMAQRIWVLDRGKVLVISLARPRASCANLKSSCLILNSGAK